MTEKVSKESIEQALQALGLVDDINKAEGNDAGDNQPTEEELAKAQEIEAITAKAKELGFDLVKAQGGDSPAAPTPASPDQGSGANGGTVTSQPMPQVGRKEIEALGTLLKAQREESDELRKSVESISEFNARLAEKLNMIEKQPLDRKSISTAKYIEKEFAKGVTDNSASNAGEKTLSLSNPVHRAHLVDTLFDAAVKEGEVKDKDLEKAIEYVEITKSLGADPRFSQRIQQRLKNEFKINLVR